VLTILDRAETAPGLLRAAACLADLMGGAMVHGLIIRMPPLATIMPSEEVLTARQENYVRAQEDVRAGVLSGIFDEWQQGTGHAAQLSDMEASAAEVIAVRGREADFLAIERERGGSAALHAALFGTDRPVLVVPPGAEARFGRRIALAWRNDPRTIRAILAAMRCFSNLERLFVLAGHRPGDRPPGLPEILIEHEIPAELRILPVGPRVFGEALLEAAYDCRADMLVMGAFVHDPLRRLILGGVTRYMLGHADFPLLMRH
jgi:nucleotide-binding universal stress UspA family protein